MSGKTIKAWAVVCKSGRMHRWGRDDSGGEIYREQAAARSSKTGLDAKTLPPLSCSPHTVVLLMGEVEK